MRIKILKPTVLKGVKQPGEVVGVSQSCGEALIAAGKAEKASKKKAAKKEEKAEGKETKEEKGSATDTK